MGGAVQRSATRPEFGIRPETLHTGVMHPMLRAAAAAACMLGLLALPPGPGAARAGQPEGAGADLPPAAAPCPADPDLSPIALPAAARALREGRPLTILAFGSSSTEGSGASAPDRTYPARLEAHLREALPGAGLTVLNRGRGGEEVTEMLARLDREVLSAAPALVIWQAGANAVLRGMAPETFRAAMADGLARLQASGAEVVLMDSQRAPRILEVPQHPVFDALMQSLAGDQQVPLFSRAELMRRWEDAGAPAAEFLGPDGLHHNDRGYDCLAGALARTLAAALRPREGESPPRPALVAGRR